MTARVIVRVAVKHQHPHHLRVAVVGLELNVKVQPEFRLQKHTRDPHERSAVGRAVAGVVFVASSQKLE